MTTDVQVGAQRIQVDDSGEGSPVLPLHSSGMSSRQWRRLREALVPRHRVLTPDFIGYGGSAPWAERRDFEHSADVAVAEAVALRAGAPVHLVGHSYGGFIAMLVAARGRVPVASVAVFEPVAFGVLYSAQDAVGMEELAVLARDGSFFAPELAGTAEWCERFVNFWGGPGYWSRLPDVQKAAFLAPGKKMFQEVRSLSYDRTPHQAYAGITAPTLLMAGTLSPKAAQHTAAILARSVQHGRLELLEGTSHMAPLTHAELVNGLIAAHIDAADRAAGR